MPRRRPAPPPPRPGVASVVAAIAVTGVLAAAAADALRPRVGVRPRPADLPAERIVLALPAPPRTPPRAAPPPAVRDEGLGRRASRAPVAPVVAAPGPQATVRAPTAPAADTGAARPFPLRDAVRPPIPRADAASLLPPAGPSVRVIDGRLLPRSGVPASVAGYDSALGRRRRELVRAPRAPLTAAERDAALRDASLGAATARAAGGASVVPMAGVSLGVGLPGGGPSNAQRARDRLADSAARDVLTRLRQRAESLEAVRREARGGARDTAAGGRP